MLSDTKEIQRRLDEYKKRAGLYVDEQKQFQEMVVRMKKIDEFNKLVEGFDMAYRKLSEARKNDTECQVLKEKAEKAAKNNPGDKSLQMKAELAQKANEKSSNAYRAALNVIVDIDKKIGAGLAQLGSK